MSVSRKFRKASLVATLGALCVAMAITALSPSAKASVANKDTKLTFSGPVEIPGKVLPAGTYTFRILDNIRARNIVEVLDESGKPIATVLTMKTYRTKPNGEALLTFGESPSNTPQALKAWWYSTDNYGRQFVYPHEEALKLARANKEPVLSYRNENGNSAKPDDLSNSKVVAIDPYGNDVAADQALGKNSSNASNQEKKSKRSQSSASNE